MGHYKSLQELDDYLRALDREYRFLGILRTSHPDYLYTTFGPFNSDAEVYEAKERFKAELRKKLGPSYYKIIPKHERTVGITLPIDSAARVAINKAIKEEYYPSSSDTKAEVEP